MLGYVYWKAKTFLKRDQVKITTEAPKIVFFTVNQYDITFHRKTEKVNCTCVAGSLWNVGEECSHAKACLMLLEEKDATKKKRN